MHRGVYLFSQHVQGFNLLLPGAFITSKSEITYTQLTSLCKSN